MMSKIKITYLGHSSLVLEINGKRVITDPVFRRRIFHLVRTAAIPTKAVLHDIDIVLISHLHYDHLDIQSLRNMVGEPLIIAPKGAGKILQENSISNFREIGIGDEVHIDDLTIRSTYARHVNRRHPLGTYADCMGYLIGAQDSVYYPGDTTLFPEMASISDHIDVALMPVWGWGPHLGRMHMSPGEAAQALTMLKPKLAIPIHWGTYLPVGMAWLKPAFHRKPPLVFADCAREISPAIEIRILKPGETTVYSN